VTTDAGTGTTHEPQLAAAAPGPSPAPLSSALNGILLILVMAVLWAGKALFLPIIIAVLLSFLFTPAVRWLASIGLPRLLGAVLVLGLVVGAVAGGVAGLAAPASEWMERLPAALTTVKQRLREVNHRVDRVNQAASQMEDLTAGSAARGRAEAAPASTLAAHVVSSAGGFLAGLLIASIALFFLLASGGIILERMVGLIPALRIDHDPNRLLLGQTAQVDSCMVLRESERLVGLYLRTTIIINFALAAALGAAFWATGLPNPWFWGACAGILNFLPYIGPLVGVPLIAIVGLASLDGIGSALIPPLIYAGFAFVEGNMITPVLLGQRLLMSPIAIFLWMALWGWLWGAAGALIAVPMLVVAKEFCSRIAPLTGIARVIEP
jgi:predicted PurR-regulated permease PerM